MLERVQVDPPSLMLIRYGPGVAGVTDVVVVRQAER